MDKIRVRVPQKDGQITGIDSSGNRRWVVKDHIIEVAEADLSRILVSVRGSSVASAPRDTPAESETDESLIAKDGK